MLFEYLEDIPGADAAFRARGADLPELFRSAWQAVHGVLTDREPGEDAEPTGVCEPGETSEPGEKLAPGENLEPGDNDRERPVRGGDSAAVRRRAIELTGTELDLLLLDFLQEQLYYKDAEGVLYAVAAVEIRAAGDQWQLQAELAGEPIDHTRGPLGMDVKAVTLDRLGLRRTADGWEATVVLDL